MRRGKTLLALFVAVCLAVCLSGCTFTVAGNTIEIRDGKVLVNGAGDEQEEDTHLYASTGGTLTLPESADSTARFAVTPVDDESEQAWYVVFNGIRTRNTDYFTAPDGSVTLVCNATGESSKLKYVKLALWEKLENATQYVEGTTVYVRLDGTNRTHTVTGLDPNKQYRVNLSYDSSTYYIYGTLRIGGAV